MILIIALVTWATVAIIQNTGPAPWFAKVAVGFEGQGAIEHVHTLSEMAGRSVGQPAHLDAAAYISARFQQYGLDPGWKQAAYLNPNPQQIVRPSAQPRLSARASQSETAIQLRHQLDFSIVLNGHAGSGSAEAPLTFLAFSPNHAPTPANLRGLDLRNQIVLLAEGNAPPDFADTALLHGAVGVLWIAQHDHNLGHSQIRLASPAQPYLQTPTIPVMRLTPSSAETLLQPTGLTLAQLFNMPVAEPVEAKGVRTTPLNLTISMQVELPQPQTVDVPIVMGYLPGSDFLLANDLVVIIAAYDGLGRDPDGTIYPAADSASGIAVMLEVARLWQENNLEPRRSVLFVAWGGGTLAGNDARQFLANDATFRHLPAQSNNRSLAPRIILQLGAVGSGSDTLLIHPDSSAKMIELAQDAAAETGITPRTQAQPVPINIWKRPSTNYLHLSWLDALTPPDQDTFDRINPSRLEAAGQIAARLLIKIVRENRY